MLRFSTPPFVLWKSPPKMKPTGSYPHSGIDGVRPWSAKSVSITISPMRNEKPSKKSFADPMTGSSTFKTPSPPPPPKQEPEFSDLYCDDIVPSTIPCDVHNRISAFDELQLRPFTPFELELFCVQIMTEVELYREIQCTKNYLVELENFKFNGDPVTAQDKKKLVTKFTQLFRRLLILKTQWSQLIQHNQTP
jgi:hypothetical protein